VAKNAYFLGVQNLFIMHRRGCFWGHLLISIYFIFLSIFNFYLSQKACQLAPSDLPPILLKAPILIHFWAFGACELGLATTFFDIYRVYNLVFSILFVIFIPPCRTRITSRITFLGQRATQTVQFRQEKQPFLAPIGYFNIFIYILLIF